MAKPFGSSFACRSRSLAHLRLKHLKTDTAVTCGEGALVLMVLPVQLRCLHLDRD